MINIRRVFVNDTFYQFVRKKMGASASFCGSRLRSEFYDPTCAVVTFHPVALAHVLDTNLCAGAGGVQKPIVAEIDAHMRESPAHGVEEDEIAGLEFLFVNRIANLALLFSSSRQQFSNSIPEHYLHESAAIQPRVGVGAATAIVDSDKFQAFEHQILRAGGVALEQGWLVAQSRRLFCRLCGTDSAKENGC